jgi:chemotaxis protein CheX
MNSTTQPLDVRQFMTRHLVEVFATMLSMEAVLAADAQLPSFADRVTGSVGFGGDSVNGIVYLHLSAQAANRVAAAMLGLGAEETPSEADVNDVIGEVTNMLTGGLKSALCDAGAPCAVSTPAIIRGTAFEIEPAPGLERLWLLFDFEPDRAAVEIHLRYN